MTKGMVLFSRKWGIHKKADKSQEHENKIRDLQQATKDFSN